MALAPSRASSPLAKFVRGGKEGGAVEGIRDIKGGFQSPGSLSAVEAESHLNLLMKEVPGWCTCHKVRSGIYLKIDKTRQMHEITEKLNSIIKEKT